MHTAFPCPDYYGSSAPPHRHRPTTSLPARRPGWAAGRDQQGGSHVHSRTVRRGRCPTMPLRPRHTYAAGIRCGLPTGDINRPTSSLAQQRGARRNPAQIRQVRAGGALLRGVHALVHCRYTFPSRSPDPHHLTVLARPGFVRAACHPPRRPPVQAALSFNRPAATGRQWCPFITTRSKSASWRSMSHDQMSLGAAAPSSGRDRGGCVAWRRRSTTPPCSCRKRRYIVAGDAR
jgi:hypothetical protein